MTVGSQNNGQNRPGQTSSAQQAGAGMGAQSGGDWDGIKEDVTQLADTALDQGRHFLDSARTQATTYVDQRKDQAAQSVSDLAHSLREACSQFDDRPNIKAFVDSAAEGLEQLSETIRSRSFADMYGDVEQVMRRRPAAVAAATLATGFLLARFLKSSAEGVRQAEMQRRRGSASQRQGSARQNQGSRSQSHAQASPGSSYAQRQV